MVGAQSSTRSTTHASARQGRATLTYKRWIGGVAAGLAVAAIAAPGALAYNNALNHDYGPANFVTTPQVAPPAGWEHAQFGPADLPIVTKPTPVPVSTILSNPQYGPANFEQPEAPLTIVSPTGFDFRDAAVGAAIAIAAMLLAAAAVLLIRRRDGHLAGV